MAELEDTGLYLAQSPPVLAAVSLEQARGVPSHNLHAMASHFPLPGLPHRRSTRLRRLLPCPSDEVPCLPNPGRPIRTSVSAGNPSICSACPEKSYSSSAWLCLCRLLKCIPSQLGSALVSPWGAPHTSQPLAHLCVEHNKMVYLPGRRRS